MEPGNDTPDKNQPVSAPQTPPSRDARKSAMRNLREWVQVIVIALLISLPIRFFIAEPFIVNGA